MAESKEARNKELVRKAFDTLFNKRDYAAAERLWSPNYIQHIVTMNVDGKSVVQSDEQLKAYEIPAKSESKNPNGKC